MLIYFKIRGNCDSRLNSFKLRQFWFGVKFWLCVKWCQLRLVKTQRLWSKAVACVTCSEQKVDWFANCELRVRGNVDVGPRYVLLDVESLGSVISLQNCFIARRTKTWLICYISSYHISMKIPSTMHFCSHVSSLVEASNKDRWNNKAGAPFLWVMDT